MFPFYSQGKKIAWDGRTKEGVSFLSSFPEQLVTGKNNTEMKLTLSTGTIYQVVGADKPDTLVGSNPIGVVLSEWSLMSPKVWQLIQPILAENDGWALFIYTPRGRNHGYKTLQVARKNPKWFAEVLPNSYTKAVTEEAIQEMRDSGMPDEMVDQEMECGFDTPIAGSYYGSHLNKVREAKRICKVPWESRLPVHTAWDLGVGDSTAIWMFQLIGAEIRIIDHLEATGEGLPYYAKELKAKPYVFGNHYAPHDIMVRELGSGKSRFEIARSLGIRFTVIPQHRIEDGIEIVRDILPRCWFDEEKCEYGIECLNQYHKEYDDLRMVYKNTPCHDWSSHSADAFRYLAKGAGYRLKKARKPDNPIKKDYNEFALG